MMKPCIELQDEGEAFVFIADFHALTAHPAPAELREHSKFVAVDFLACGLDPEKAVFFRQSDVPEVTELAWILACHTTVGLLERCHSYKEKIAQGMTPNHGLFSYPVLMACDILIYQSDVVPVGKDQKQHLEVTRDIATRFNNTFGNIFVIPEARIRASVAVVPGLDGRKMSKSYGNTIELFEAEKPARSKFMKIVTDSTPLAEPKNPDTCNVFALYKLFATDDELAAMRSKYAAAGYGYGQAKQELFDKFWEYFRPMREKRAELLDNLDYVENVLRNGAETARAEAAKTMTEVRRAVGLR